MVEIIHVQTVMLKEELDKLKELTGEHTTKDAMYKAVTHYFACVGKPKEKED